MPKTESFRQPSRAEWTNLYTAAEEFRQIAPWEWMFDRIAIAVENPSGGETAYCCILGAAGQEFGLLMYLGRDGLEVHNRSVEQHARMMEFGSNDPVAAMLSNEIMRSYHAISINFVDASELDREERRRQKRLIRKKNEARSWVLATRYVRGKQPRDLSAAETRFAVDVIARVKEVVLRMRDEGAAFFKGAPFGHLWMLTQQTDPATREITWSGSWQKPEIDVRSGRPVDVLRGDPSQEAFADYFPATTQEHARWKALSQNLPVYNDGLHVFSFLPDNPVARKETDGLIVLGCVSSVTRMFVGSTCLTNADDPIAIRSGLTSLFETLRARPDGILLDQEDLIPMLQPLARALDLDMYFADISDEYRREVRRTVEQRIVDIARGRVESIIRADDIPQSGRIRSSQLTGHDTIVPILEKFSRAHADEEFAESCRKLTMLLHQIDTPSPLNRGRPEIWACAIAYLVERIENYREQQPTWLTTEELCDWFDVKYGTLMQKQKKLLELMELN